MGRQILLTLLFVIVATMACCAGQASAQTIWAVGNTGKIGPADSIQTLNYVWSKSEKQVSIKAAGNEHEPFQLIITAEGGSLENVSVTVSDLTGGDTTIPSENITLYREAFINVTRQSHYSGHPLLGVTRVTPDALIPFKDPYGSDATPGTPFDVPSGENQPVWVDVYVPQDTLTGRYTGTITVTEGSVTIDTVALAVDVWDFELPVEGHLKYVIYSFSETLVELFNEVYGVNVITDQVMENHYRALADRRMGVIGIHKRPSYDDATGFDWTDVETLYDRLVNLYHFPVLSMPAIYYDERFEEDGEVWWEGQYAIKDPSGLPYTAADFTEGSDFMVKAAKYYQRLYDDFSAKGWIDKHFAELNDESGHVSDEPYNIGQEGFDRVRQWSEILHGVNPTIKFLLAGDSIIPSTSYDDARGYVDIWDMYLDEIQLNAQTYRSHLSANPDEELWMVPNAYADFIDYPAIYHRMSGCFAYKYGITGIELWSAFAWFDADQEYYDPWKSATPPAAHFGLGGGALFYPGYNIENRGINIEGPLTSIRMELNREAIEDYEYFLLLEQQIGSSYGTSLADKIIPSQLYYGIPTQPEDFYSVRETIGDILSNGMSVQMATLSGVVRDSNSLPVAGALVSMDGAAGITDSNGTYSITVMPGTYTVKASSDRYTFSSRSITLEQDELITDLDFVLTLIPTDSVLLFNSFDNVDDLWTDLDGITVERSTAYTTDGSHSMKMTIDDNAEETYAGIEYDSSQNWSDYASLEFDIYNDSPYGSLMDIVIYNSKWEIIFEQAVIPLSPKAFGHIVVELNSSFNDIISVGFGINIYGQGDKDLYVDNFRLISGDGSISVEGSDRRDMPAEYALDQNYPNPFNAKTTISFYSHYETKVTLKVYNILGEEVATLFDDTISAGQYSVDFDASEFSSGIYFYRIVADSFKDTKRLMLLK